MGPILARFPAYFSSACMALAALPNSACASHEPAESSRQVWVGAVQDSDAMVGVVQAGNAARIFVCGGPNSLLTQTRWFSSPNALASRFSLSSGAFQLAGTARADWVEGTVSSESGEAYSFSARHVDSAALAGVYDALGPCGHLGLIVQPSSKGEPPAAQGTCLGMQDGSAVVQQVNPLMPLERDANGGVPVTVGADVEQVIILRPLVPAGS